MKRILGLIAGILLILGGIALILRNPADLNSLSLYTLDSRINMTRLAALLRVPHIYQPAWS